MKDTELIWEAYRNWGGTYVFDLNDSDPAGVQDTFESARAKFEAEFLDVVLISGEVSIADDGVGKTIEMTDLGPQESKLAGAILYAEPDLAVRLIHSKMNARLVELLIVDMDGQLYCMFMYTNIKKKRNRFHIYEVLVNNLVKVDEFWKQVFEDQEDRYTELPPGGIRDYE
tara:strand:- start:32 stop:544 length:513 start_codon:yes stop_codon:yes gene_type:complete